MIICSVIIPNVIAMTLLLVMLFSANFTMYKTRRLDARIFNIMVICNFYQCLGEIASVLMEGKAGSGFHAGMVALNTSLFMVNIFFAFIWVAYADFRIYNDEQHAKNHGLRLMIPAILILIGCIVNIFVPVFFRITPDNHYERETFFCLPYLVTYFYLLYGTVFIYRFRKQANKYVFLPAIVFMIPIILGSGVQYFFYGISTVWAGVAIALVAVYVNVQNEVSYTDLLSGLYSRNYMYQYLETISKRNRSQKKIGGIMLDIDKFKTINDTYGHLVGDDAIRQTGRILHKCLKDSTIAIRYGGDEFVVLRQIEKEQDILDVMECLKKAETRFEQTGKKKYSLNFSMGYSIFNPETDDIDDFLEKMDIAMYEKKRMTT